VLSGIDGATNASGREKARSVAAALGEQDQERLRSMPVEQLATYGSVTTPYTVGGAAYNVVSNVEWVRDDTGGTISCSNDGREADYLHITSTVTSTVVGARTAAVRVDSIVAPNIQYSTTHGSLAVKVLNNAGQPVQGIMVSPTGASAPTPQNTNAQGCAVFQNVDIGSDVVSLSALNFVDHGRNSVATAPAVVAAGKLTLVAMDYDYAATVNVNIETYQPGTSTTIPSKAWRVAAENGDDLSMLINEPVRTPQPASESASFTVNNLVPFSGAYSFYTGACRYSDPTFASAYATYFASNPGAVGVTPGSTTTITVRQPPLNFQMLRDRNSLLPPPDGMTVIATPIQAAGDSCVEPSIPLKTFSTLVTKGIVARAVATNGTYVEAGLPFGYYSLCFQRSGPRYTIYPDDFGGPVAGYDNTAPLGKALPVTIDASNTGVWHSGTCAVTP
jgi:hypothetical protein